MLVQTLISYLVKIAFVFCFCSLALNANAQQPNKYDWVDSLLSTKNVVEAKSRLDSIYLLNKGTLEPVFYFKKAHVYYDLFMQSTKLIGLQDNQWLLQSLTAYNIGIDNTYQQLRITDVQLQRLKLNIDLAIRYVNLDIDPNKTSIELYVQALKSAELWAAVSKLPINKAPIYRGLASLYRRSGKSADATEYLELLFADEASKFTVEDVTTLTSLYMQDGMYKKAWKRYSWYYSVAPKSSTQDRNLVLSDWVEMSLINATDSLLIRFLVDSSRFNDAYEYFVIASLNEGREQLDSAEHYYLMAIQADSMLLDASYNLGIMYYNQASLINKMLASGATEEQVEQLTTQRQELYIKALPLFVRSRELNADSINKLVSYLKKVTATE